MSAPFHPPNVGSGGKRPSPPPDWDCWRGAPPMSRRERITIFALCVASGIVLAAVCLWAVRLGESLATLAGKCP